MLNKKEEESLSKFMSKLLRHTPEEFGLTLDHEGYIEDTYEPIMVTATGD